MIELAGRGCAWLALIAACAATPRPVPIAPAPALARVEISAIDCPPRAAAEARLRAVLAAHDAERSDLVIRVDAVPGGAVPGGAVPGDAMPGDAVPGTDPAEVQLVVVRGTGDIGLDRRYRLAPADCASAAELLALGVDRFLSAFPAWAGPPRPPPPAPVVTRWGELYVVSAVNSMWLPIGVDGQVGALVDYGGARHRLGGSVVVRGGVPQAAGSGRFQQTALLAGASWRRRAGAWAARVEVRGGAVLVTGLGFARNDRDWLPWWEVAVFGGRALGWGAIGVEIAATGLRHRAVTRDGLVAEDIPFLRVGVSGQFGLRSRTP